MLLVITTLTCRNRWTDWQVFLVTIAHDVGTRILYSYDVNYFTGIYYRNPIG